MWLVRAFVPRLVLIKMAQSTKAHIFTKIRIKFAFLTFVTLFFGSSLAPCSLYSLSLPLAFTVASAHLPLHAPKRVYMCVYLRSFPSAFYRMRKFIGKSYLANVAIKFLCRLIIMNEIVLK